MQTNSPYSTYALQHKYVTILIMVSLQWYLISLAAWCLDKSLFFFYKSQTLSLISQYFRSTEKLHIIHATYYLDLFLLIWFLVLFLTSFSWQYFIILALLVHLGRILHIERMSHTYIFIVMSFMGFGRMNHKDNHLIDLGIIKTLKCLWCGLKRVKIEPECN